MVGRDGMGRLSNEADHEPATRRELAHDLTGNHYSISPPPFFLLFLESISVRSRVVSPIAAAAASTKITVIKVTQGVGGDGVVVAARQNCRGSGPITLP